MTPALMLLGIILVALAPVTTRSIKIIGQAEVVVIERFGRFHASLDQA